MYRRIVVCRCRGNFDFRPSLGQLLVRQFGTPPRSGFPRWVLQDDTPATPPTFTNGVMTLATTTKPRLEYFDAERPAGITMPADLTIEFKARFAFAWLRPTMFPHVRLLQLRRRFGRRIELRSG